MGGGARHVGLLRGVNVGGRRALHMDELRRIVEAAGGEDVETYVASGNVLFRASDPDAVARAVEQELAGRLGLDVTVLVRSADELAAVLAASPFPDADPRALHVTFLARPPEPSRLEAIDGGRFAPDAFAPAGPELVVCCPNGYGRTKLSGAFFERALGVAATTRNWRTVTALAELARA